MSILDQSYNIALSLLPKTKNSRSTRNKFFHFAFAYQKSKLLAIGQNNPEKTHTRALKIAKKFNLDSEYPYLHAETDLISRIWNKYYINDSIRLVVIRLNKQGELRNSKPCDQCCSIIKSVGIDKVYWSVNNGFKK
jgi:tRNA(Arg) A34 adenosine deaminase TadA